MKRILLFLPVLFLVMSFSGKPTPLDPRGMVKVADNFWVNQTEVLTKDWIEYFYAVTKDSGDHHASRLRPALLNNWVIPSSRENLHRERVYNNTPTSLRNLRMAPITYITYQQAIAYCEWRSAVMNKRLRTQGIIKTVRFRLPTEEEWNLILAYNERWEDTKVRRANRYVKKIKSQLKSVSVFQVPSTLRSKRIYQLYHNVSEMTSVPGLAIGLNNQNFDLGVSKNSTFRYQSPGPMIGFRCIAEFID